MSLFERKKIQLQKNNQPKKMIVTFYRTLKYPIQSMNDNVISIKWKRRRRSSRREERRRRSSSSSGSLSRDLYPSKSIFCVCVRKLLTAVKKRLLIISKWIKFEQFYCDRAKFDRHRDTIDKNKNNSQIGGDIWPGLREFKF